MLEDIKKGLMDGFGTIFLNKDKIEEDRLIEVVIDALHAPTVVEVLERNTRQVVGRLFCESGVGFVLPDNKRLTHEVVIPEKDCAGITMVSTSAGR